MPIVSQDCLNRTFQVGKYFTTPRRQHSSMWVQVGIVLGFHLGINDNGDPILFPIVRTAEREGFSGWHIGRKNAVLRRPDRATIVSTFDVPPSLVAELGVILEVGEEPCTTS